MILTTTISRSRSRSPDLVRQLASMTLLPQQLTSALGASPPDVSALHAPGGYHASPQPTDTRPSRSSHPPILAGLNGSSSSMADLKQQNQQRQSQPSSSSFAVQRDPLRNQGPSAFPFFLALRPQPSDDSPAAQTDSTYFHLPLSPTCQTLASRTRTGPFTGLMASSLRASLYA